MKLNANELNELAGLPFTFNPDEAARIVMDAELNSLALPNSTELVKPKIGHAWKSHLVPVLRDLGFSGKGSDFCRVTQRSFQAISLQRLNYGGCFVVNFGMQPIILAAEGRTPFKEIECAVRSRWTNGNGEIWWCYENNAKSMAAAAQAAGTLLRKHCDRHFEWLEMAVFGNTEPDWDEIHSIGRASVVHARILLRSVDG
ncbi:DUF4304 domain-containing protein [uncultured Sphingorhabdus sp.]|uniref:DUF4304 domain-containing protein n=1 Tax=uncultured Sphingorhabdus sp. TaxID=1686106 RepID=UPI0026303682|nr:DUF4304 domain-containing protein [uncultured Sphingorhabdus sp.]